MVTPQERRERERADRYRLIVDTARDMAERDGWQAVTTRRLAEAIEYSQPVIYSHFANMDALIEVIALEGFAQMAGELRQARRSTDEPAAAPAMVAQAYVDFAKANPAVFEAMFSRPTNLTFASEETPPQMIAAFGEIQAAVEPFAGDRPAGTLTEVFWSLVHGLVTLNRDGRLSPNDEQLRFELAMGLFAGR